MDRYSLKGQRWRFAAMALGALGSGAALAQGASLREQALAAPPEVQVFVQLETPSVAEFSAAALQANGATPSSDVQRAHAARISAEQSQFRQQLQSLGAEVLSQQRAAANGFRIRIAPDRIESLRELPGVRTVGRVELHKITNADSVPWIGAPEFWSTYGLTGEDVSIGVIDTGIDYLHANFGGPGTVADYNANDRNVIEPGTFPTAKVVGGYDFAGPTYNANVAGSTPAPDPDPLDVNGHGSHVAGTAAGLGVPGVIGQGVAPGAKLYALKVFGDAGGSTDLTSLAIEWAMDPNADGDTSDHLDVINMSLGSPFGDPADPSAISSNNAAALGVIVVTSAGNEGDTPYVTGAPGVASSAISTAANTPGGRFYAEFEVTAPAALAGVYESLEGAGPVTFRDTGPIADDLVAASPLDGCTPLTNASEINGNVALIIRGVCGFVVKYQQAQAAGARAIVVYNDGAAPDRIAPIVMGGLDNSVLIPGLMISNTIGAQLAAAEDPTVSIDSVLNPALNDQIATFSSRGPGHGGSTFKPDLSAPGVAIISTDAGSGNGAANLQGTSMAAPHVAGAAALLRELHPELNQSAIKALLQNSTVTPASGDTDVARIGVGAIRIPAAAALSSFAKPGGVSFGRINVSHPVNRVEKVWLTNLEKAPRNYSVQHVPGQTYPGVTVTCPTNVNVGRHGARQFNIRLRFDPSAAFAQGVFDNGSISQSEVDGWCVLTDGEDTLRVAYLAVVDPASRMQVHTRKHGAEMRVRNTGPTLGIAEGFTFAGAAVTTSEEYGMKHALDLIGFRAADPALYFGDPVIEFAIELCEGWEHISNLQFDIYLDTDNDGVEDVRLVAADRSVFQDVDPGQFVTAQFDIGGGGNLDWLVTGWDFNDRVAILPFTRVGGFLGRVPDAFSYRLVVTGRDGTTDTHTGTIDFANEVQVDLNSFALDPGGVVDINVISGTDPFIWLLPNDRLEDQVEMEYVWAP